MKIDIDEIAAPYELELEFKFIDFKDRIDVIRVKQEILECYYIHKITFKEMYNLYVKDVHYLDQDVDIHLYIQKLYSKFRKND